jgi:alpha-L-arabinofuranosidase
VGQWSEQMLTTSANHMSLISEHVYWQNKDTLSEHVNQAPESLKKVADAHREYRRKLPSLQGKNIRIAMDEWNYWDGPNEYGELGVRYFMRDGLGIAAGLHEFFRNSDIFFMANYAQTVNVIGAIKTTPTAAEFETTGLVLKLYRERYGVTPVAVAGVPAGLDVTAAWNADRTALTVGVVNATEKEQSLTLQVQGASLEGSGMRWVVAGGEAGAFNEPGRRRAVDIRQSPITAGGPLRIPKLGVAVFELRVK